MHGNLEKKGFTFHERTFKINVRCLVKYSIGGLELTEICPRYKRSLQSKAP